MSKFSVILLSFLLCFPPARATELPVSFNFVGAGYGHGVGMSQIGARGQALEGKSATDILKYYYKDVTVEPIKDDQLIRVNIGHLLSNFSLKTDTKLATVELFNGEIGNATDVVADKVIPAKVSINFSLLGNSIVPNLLYANGRLVTLTKGKSWTLRWRGEGAVASTKIGMTTTKYRYGQIQIKLVKAPLVGYRIEATNTLRLHDEYLWGIGEVPSSWPMAALQAQVIASRTYALSKVGKMRAACDCELYSISQDQNFVGYSKEIEPRWGMIWKQAVNSTSADSQTGLAVLYKSLPIATYFFSSSAGVSVPAQDVWGKLVPYISSVSDPWSMDPVLNPRYFHWERGVDASTVADAFGLSDVASLEIVSRNVSQTVAKIVATSSSGVHNELSGEAFRSKVKLPSAWFDFSPTPLSSANPVPSSSATPS